MKLLKFRTESDAEHVGVLTDDGVVDLTGRAGVPSLNEVILGRSDEAILRTVRIGQADYATDDVRFALPLAAAARILCVGVNYADRNAEYKDGSAAPRYPSLFFKTSAALVPHREAIIRPRESEQLDYEGEIVVVIGRSGRRIARARTIDHIFGLTIMNEGTIRDWVRHGKFNVTQGKNFDRSGSLGPWIETDIAALDLKDLRVETRVNGELRQSDTTASMTFPIDYLIEYASTFMTLQPGDLISTGTPTGAGARFDPPRWLVPGDTVEVSVEGVGRLSNTIEDEAA